MKGILKFILFLEIVLLCSCVNDEKRSGAFGGMSLHLSAKFFGDRCYDTLE